MSSNANNEILIGGLKNQISRQVGLKNWEHNQGNYNQRALVDSWRLLYAHTTASIVEDAIWKYVLSYPSGIWKKEDTKTFGIFSKIGDYTNKKGVVSKAHFTQNDYYLGSVKSLGDKPKSYIGNFIITKERFTLKIEKLNEIKHLNGEYNLENLFEAIPV
jgi:hypothetical protein